MEPKFQIHQTPHWQPPQYKRLPMSTPTWPQPPFRPKDYPALLELLGPEEFERRVCSLRKC